MKTIIKNGLIVTFIHEGYHAIKMKYGDILIDNDRITEIRESTQGQAGHNDLELLESEVQIIEAQGKMILPGCVNLGSSCLAAKLLNGLLPDYPRHNWQGTMNYHRIQPLLKIADDILSHEEKCDLVRWAMQETIAAGTTTMVDLNRPGFTKAIRQVAEELGVRAWVIEMQTAGEFPIASQDGRFICDELHGGSLDLAGTQVEDSLIVSLDGLYSIETTSEEMWENLRSQRNQKGEAKTEQPLFMYGAYSQYEKQFSQIRYGKSPLAVIYDQGALDQNTIILNSFYTDFFDRERIRTAGAHTSFSAVSAMQDGHTLPIVTMLSQDINTALGTGYYGLSMIEEMKAAAYGGKLETKVAHQYQASDAFYAATIAGAKALKQPLGRIEPGFYADLLIVNLERLGPLNYPLINFVYHAQPQDIEDVLVAGKVIASQIEQKERRQTEQSQRAQKCAEKVWQKARETFL